MGGHTVKRIDEMEPFRRAGAELGVESFGLQVFDLPAGSEPFKLGAPDPTLSA
jgi:hypothetical protein